MEWYALYGKNAMGVYTNYKKLQEASPYLKSAQCKRFDTLKEARAHAEFQHNMLNDGNSVDDFYFPDSPRLNWLYYRPKKV